MGLSLPRPLSSVQCVNCSGLLGTCSPFFPDPPLFKKSTGLYPCPPGAGFSSLAPHLPCQETKGQGCPRLPPNLCSLDQV